MNKTLIIGCGFLGSNILTHLKTKESFVIGTKFQSKIDGFRQLDITNIDSVNECITEENPDLVINCAANTNLDDLEKNQESANLVNGYGVENIAKACKQNFSRLIHISTDAVFDGKKGLYKEDDKPNPINMYGRSKLLGESLVEKNCNNFLIVRTNMFGYNKKGNFLFNWVLKSLKEKKQIVGFDDIVFNPLEISFLSSLIVELGNLKFSGIVHLGSDEIISNPLIKPKPKNLLSILKVQLISGLFNSEKSSSLR